MERDKGIHFGNFVRWHRMKKGWKQWQLAEKSGVGERTVLNIEKSAAPYNEELTIVSIAQALGFDPETFDEVWRKTPVPSPKENDEEAREAKLWDRLFSAADALAKKRLTRIQVLTEAIKRSKPPSSKGTTEEPTKPRSPLKVPSQVSAGKSRGREPSRT